MPALPDLTGACPGGYSARMDSPTGAVRGVKPTSRTSRSLRSRSRLAGIGLLVLVTAAPGWAGACGAVETRSVPGTSATSAATIAATSAHTAAASSPTSLMGASGLSPLAGSEQIGAPRREIRRLLAQLEATGPVPTLGLGLHDTEACGVSKSAGARVKLEVVADGPGPDTADSEFVMVFNGSSKTIDLRGWLILTPGT